MTWEEAVRIHILHRHLELIIANREQSTLCDVWMADRRKQLDIIPGLQSRAARAIVRWNVQVER
jgi:hypothetical protein